MHEFSIAQSLIKNILSEMKRHDLKEISKVGLGIGKFSGVVPSALAFCFDAAKENTVLAGVALEIEWEPAKGQCKDCNHGFNVEEWLFSCPQCGSTNAAVSGGTDLAIRYMETPDD